jgi:hypothetical protein
VPMGLPAHPHSGAATAALPAGAFRGYGNRDSKDTNVTISGDAINLLIDLLRGLVSYVEYNQHFNDFFMRSRQPLTDNWPWQEVVAHALWPQHLSFVDNDCDFLLHPQLMLLLLLFSPIGGCTRKRLSIVHRYAARFFQDQNDRYGRTPFGNGSTRRSLHMVVKNRIQIYFPPLTTITS